MRNIIALVIIPVYLLIQGCQKDGLRPQEKKLPEPGPELSIEQARNWFNRQEQNQAQTASKQSARIKKFTPQWGKAISGEDREYHVVEVPLQFEKSPGFIVQDDSESRSGQDVNGKTILLILKHKPTNLLRSVLMHYMETAGGTNISYLKRDKGFSGHILFTETDGRLIKGWIFKKGKVVAGTSNETREGQGSRAALPENCETKEIRWYERSCIFYNDYSIECSQWQYSGSTYQTYCSEEGSGGVSGPGECNVPTATEVLSGGRSVLERGTSTYGLPKTGTNGEITKDWSTYWYFYRGSWLHYTWRYVSYEKGVHKKVNNAWKWKSITHVSHAQVGSAPFTTNCNMLMATPGISTDETVARMTLDYEVKMCIECKGLNFGCASQIGKSSNFWTIAPNGIVT